MPVVRDVCSTVPFLKWLDRFYVPVLYLSRKEYVGRSYTSIVTFSLFMKKIWYTVCSVCLSVVAFHLRKNMMFLLYPLYNCLTPFQKGMWYSYFIYHSVSLFSTKVWVFFTVSLMAFHLFPERKVILLLHVYCIILLQLFPERIGQFFIFLWWHFAFLLKEMKYYYCVCNGISPFPRKD